MKTKLTLTIFLSFLLINCGDTSQGYKPNYVAGPLQSCSVESVVGGAIMSCPDGSEVFISNGTDGIDGLNGLFVDVIDPCGPQTAHDEVLFIDINNNYYAWFKNVGLVILNENTIYQTTDGTKATFKIENGEFVEVSCQTNA